MNNNGKLEYCLGIQITKDRSSRSITLNQSKFIGDILKHFNLAKCKPIDTPLQVGVCLTHSMFPKTSTEKENMKHVPYSNISCWMHTLCCHKY